TALTNLSTRIIAIIACALVVVPLLPSSVNLLTILLVAGVAGVLLYTRSFRREARASAEATPAADAPKTNNSVKSVIAAALLSVKALAAAAPSVGLLTVALVFFKIGLLMFGGGLVIAPLLQQELVDGPHWLTTRQLVDGLALGQLTPGPVTTVATFAG